jgi:hypothetical protein
MRRVRIVRTIARLPASCAHLQVDVYNYSGFEGERSDAAYYCDVVASFYCFSASPSFCCAHKPSSNFDNMAACTEKYPADQEFMTMAYPILYKWSIAAKMAQDNIATARALEAPVDPCTAALAYKGYTIIDQAMKYH